MMETANSGSIFFRGGYHETFYQLFLEEEVLSNQMHIGITMAIGTFSEMIVMLISGKILKYLKVSFHVDASF